MHERFMNIKKLVVPVITLVVVASQLMGCAAVTQNELLSMINKGESVEIEVAVPTFAEQRQGEEGAELNWEVLASLNTVKDLRRAWDNKLLISLTDTGKNGMLYVNTSGENENNNTLRVALHNREFIKQIDDKIALKELADSVRTQYADIESSDTDKKAVYLGINGYFNLLQDAIPNYCNADSTITRAEFMTMVMRAETPVDTELAENADFTNAVGANEFNRYAQEVAESSYLDISSKSLNNQTYNGSMTRVEAIYLLMSRYFNTELSSVDTKGASLSDCKDGGNIAEKQQFSGKDYAKSYELTYALQNPDKGAPTDLYKALVLANEKGVISNETRWDEAITKSEAIEMLIETLKQETGIEQFSYTKGTYETEKSAEFLAGQESEGAGEKNGGTGEDTGNSESLSVDVLGVDGEIADGEYDEEKEKAKEQSTDIAKPDDYTESDNYTELTGDTYTDEEIEQILKEMGIEVEVSSSTISSGTGASSSSNNGNTDSGYVDPDFAGVDTSAKPGTGGEYVHDGSDPNIPAGHVIQ